MVFDRGTVAETLEANTDAIRDFLDQDEDLLERYRELLETLPDRWSPEGIRKEVRGTAYPGALPTESFAGEDSILQSHEESDQWESHEAVNEWARDLLLDVPIMAADGSEIPPTTQFNLPVAYVQVAWCLNHHVPEGNLERGLEAELLTPGDISRQSSSGEFRFVDSSQVGHHRYECEGTVVVEQMEQLAAARDAGDLERPPIVLYDGPLIISFTAAFDGPAQRRYAETMGRMLAASEHLEIPLVGYVGGTQANELARLLRLLHEDELGDRRLPADWQLLNGLLSPWGDWTVPFVSRRDDSLETLQGTYRGETSIFSHDVLFSYLNVPPGGGIDRLEFPSWLTNSAGPTGYNSMLEYTVEMVRAEAAIGRGYPEVLQQADSDAVLTHEDRRAFLRLLQRWAEEHDVPVEWDPKALSKELRRR